MNAHSRNRPSKQVPIALRRDPDLFIESHTGMAVLTGLAPVTISGYEAVLEHCKQSKGELRRGDGGPSTVGSTSVPQSSVGSVLGGGAGSSLGGEAIEESKQVKLYVVCSGKTKKTRASSFLNLRAKVAHLFATDLALYDIFVSYEENKHRIDVVGDEDFIELRDHTSLTIGIALKSQDNGGMDDDDAASSSWSDSASEVAPPVMAEARSSLFAGLAEDFCPARAHKTNFVFYF